MERPETKQTAGGPERRSRRRRGGGGKGRGRKKAKEFMDEAYPAYVRYAALGLWREVEEIKGREGADEERRRALETLARFEERGRYASLWRRNWAEIVGERPLSEESDKTLEAVHEAAARSFEEEEEARRGDGEPGLLEEGDGRRFLDLALGRLFEESEGEIETL